MRPTPRRHAVRSLSATAAMLAVLAWALSACSSRPLTEQCLGTRLTVALALPDGGAWVGPDGGFDGGASLEQALNQHLSGAQCRASNFPGTLDCRQTGADCATTAEQTAATEASVRQQLQTLAPELLGPDNPKADPCACRAWGQ